MQYKKKTKLFSVRKTILTVVPKPIAEMAGITKDDSLIWTFDGKEIKVEPLKNGTTVKSSN